MSWQDELRRLDEELATGRISADDYRARRDQIMSAAVSPGGEPAPAAPQTNESTTIFQPVKPPQEGGGGDADKTQIVPGQNVSQSDHTQVVGGGWQAQAPGGDDASRTQIVPGVPPQAQAGARPIRPAPPGQGGFPPQNQPPNQPQNQPPWQQEQQYQEQQYNEELSPPWGGQEFLPLAAAGTPDWARQGPEVFENEKKSGPGKVIGIIAIVVVLLGVAAGAYFMFRPDDKQAGGDPKETRPPASETTPEEPPEPEGPIAELPGESFGMSDVDNFEKVVALNYLTDQEIAIYQTGGAADAAIARSKDGETNIIVLVVGTADAASAVTARDALYAQQLVFDQVAREPAAPAGVLASINEAASRGPLIRAHYASGNFVVRIEVQGPDLESVNATFDELLGAQLERVPVDG